MSVPTKAEVCDRIEAGLCPACLLPLDPPLETHVREGLGIAHTDGDRVCQRCGTGWKVWTSEVTGKRHYGQTGGVLGALPAGEV